MTCSDIKRRRGAHYKRPPLKPLESQEWINEKNGLLTDYRLITQESLNKLAALYPEERFKPILDLIVDTLNNDYNRFKVILNSFPEFQTDNTNNT